MIQKLRTLAIFLGILVVIGLGTPFNDIPVASAAGNPFLNLLLNDGSGLNAADASGNNNTGLLNSPGGPTWITGGVSGGALEFDGVNDSVYVNQSSTVNSVNTGVTVAAWIYRTANPSGFQTVVSRQVANGESEHYFLGFENGKYRWFVNTSNGYSDYTAGMDAPVGQWVHVVGTYDGANVKLYVNGALHFTRSHIGTFPVDSTGIALGVNHNNAAHTPDEAFKGKLDNVVLYNSALTAAEVTQLYDSSNGVTDKLVMPLGDSLTYGFIYCCPNDSHNEDGGYRRFLWEKIIANGFTDVNFVGSQVNGIPTIDRDHEGYGGATTGDIAAIVESRLFTYSPNTILLLAGTNDLYANKTPQQTLDSLSALLNQIHTARPTARILLANIPGVRVNNDFSPQITQPEIDELNAGIPSLVNTRVSQGWNIQFVNLYGAGLDRTSGSTDFGPDGLHLSPAGYSKLADAWYAILYPVADSVPPSVPTGLIAAPASSTRINLNWTASTDNVAVAGYRIFRNTVAIDVSATNSYQDINLTPNTTYNYAVSAYDAANNESAKTAVVPGTTAAGGSTLVLNLLFSEGGGPSAADATGNGNSALLTNGAGWTAGKSGSGLNLDGVNDYAFVSDSPSLDFVSTGVTVAAWVNRTAGQTGYRSVVSREVGNSDLEHYFLGFEGGQYRWLIRTTNGYSNVSLGGNAAATGQWVHLVGTYDGANVKLYVNGIENFATAKTGTFPADFTGITIGAGHNSGAHAADEAFNGKIDDVRVYDYALDQSAITALFNGAGGSETTPPSIPTGLTATPVSPTRIDLGWTASTDNVAVTGYRIFRNNVELTTTANTTYQDQSVVASTTYSYAVAAFDGSNNESARSAPASATTPAAGATFILSLPFNEVSGTNAADVSGNGNNGTLNDGAVFTAGHAGNAVNFDGIDEHVYVNSSTSISSISSGITVAAWVNRTVAQTGGQAVLSRQVGTTSDEHYLLGFAEGEYRWFVKTTNGYSDFNAGSAANGLGQWVHLVGTYDGANVKLYVNGLLDFSAPKTGTFPADFTGITIGGAYNNSAHTPVGEAFNGKIDDVRIYSNALTQTEVTQLYQSSSGGGSEATPPSVPTTLTATPFSSAKINLAWGASTDNVAVTGYRIFRDGTPIATTANLSYSDFGLAANTAYGYAVSAIDAASNESARTAVVTASTSVPGSTLVLNLLFNEGSGLTAADATGNGNNAGLANGAGWTAGKTGSGLNLDGSNDHAYVSDTPSLDSVSTAGVTVAAWVNRTASQTGYRTVVSRQVGNTDLEHYFLGFEGGQYRWFVNTTNGYSNFSAGGTALAVGQWVHLVGTYDGTTVTLYVNGVLNFTAPKVGAFPADFTGIAIGANHNSAAHAADEAFNGKIDDVRIYDYALDQNAVTALFNGGGGSETTPPSVPTGLTATPINPTRIDLGWTASTDNVAVTGYRIFRNNVELTTTANTTYQDQSVVANTTYGYAVAAYDGSNNQSARTAVVSATTPTAAAAFVLNLPFNEASGTSAADVSGNGNNGTLLNGAAFVPGNTGNAVNFDGSGAHVRVNSSTTISSISAGITVAAWVNRTVAQTGGQVILSRQVGTTSDEHYLLGFADGEYRWYVKTTNGYSDFDAGSTAVAVGTWVHLVGTYDGTNVKLYVNGVQDFSAGKTGAFPADSTAITIGGAYNNSAHTPVGEAFNGKIDDVRIYNNALTQAEVTQLYQSTIGGGSETTPPSVPTALAATPVSSTRINLAWNASTDNVGVTGYRIFRGGTFLAATANLNYSDIGLAASTSYGYAVSAVDAANNESARTAVVSATTFAPGSTLVLNLLFNEGSGPTATDATGNGNSGALTNGAGWTEGKTGNGLNLDGSNDYAYVSGSQGLNSVSTAGLTVAAWVNRTANQAGYRSVVSRQVGNGELEHYFLGFEGSQYRWLINTTNGYSNVSLGGNAASLGQWVLLVGTYDGTNVKLYVNGVQNFSTPKNGTFPADFTGITIGAGHNSVAHTADEAFNGKIDDVRIYDYALDQDAVTALFNSGGGSETTPPSVPTNLTATPINPTRIDLAWNASTDNVAVTGYRIFRNNVEINTTPNTTYQDLSLAPNTTYGYAVAAFDGSSNESARTAVVSATTPTAAAAFVLNLPFNEASGTNAADISGNANNGTLLGGATFVPGNTGNAVNFDGSDDHVLVSNSTTISSISAGITVAAWVNRSAIQTGGQSILSRQIGNSDEEHYLLGLSNGQYRWYVKTTNGLSDFNIGSAAATVGTWVHLVGTYDGANVKLYVNGVQDFSVVKTGTFPADNTGITIGGAYNNAGHTPLGEAFNGKIDDVRIYNNALTQAEVTQLYNSTIGGGSETTPPSVPTGLTATPFNSTRINLAWNASTDNVGVTGYRIFRGGTFLASTATLGYSDIGLTANTSYGYAVSAVDAANNESARTAVVSATTFAPGFTQVLSLLFNEASGPAIDSTGNKNDGALANGASFVAGHSGNAVNLDGINDTVNISNSPSLNSVSTAGLTVAAWVNRTVAQTGYRTVISRQVGNTDMEHYWLGFEGNQYRWFVNTTNGYSNFSVGDTSLVAPGAWVHLVGTYDGSNVRLYVNGVLSFTSPKTGTFPADFTGIAIGVNHNNAAHTPDEAFNGKVDDVKIYDYPLDQAGVTALFNTP